MSDQQAKDLVIGAYTDGKDIPAVYHFIAKQKKARTVFSDINPAFIIKHQGYYYVAAEHPEGAISVLDSEFKVVSRVKSMGKSPCHLSIDPSDHYLVVPNHQSATTVVFKLESHIPTQIHSHMTHQGSSSHPQRQTTPHPSCSAWSDCGKILFVSDLGTDCIYYYAFSPQKLILEKGKSIKIEAAGPSMLVNGREGSKLLYLTGQLDNSVRILSYKGDHGLQQISAFKVSSNEGNILSSIKYFGSQIFVSMRGDDKIMIFDQKGQTMEHNCSFKVASWPRHFAITSDGGLYVACEKANLVQRYKISAQKIMLQSEMEIVTPSVIVIV